MSLTGLYKVWASYKPTVSPDEFVGREGELFFDPVSSQLRVSDGVSAFGSKLNSIKIELLSNNELSNSFSTSTLVFDTDSFDLEQLSNGNIKILSKGNGSLNTGSPSGINERVNIIGSVISNDGSTTIVNADTNTVSASFIGNIFGGTY